MLVVLSGGGTAGHINPALALADEGRAEEAARIGENMRASAAQTQDPKVRAALFVNMEPVVLRLLGAQVALGVVEEAERLESSLTGRLYGVLCRSDLDTARWILACLSAGKTAVPLSRRYGAAHADAIRQAAGLSCILTEDGPISVGDPLPDEQDLEDVRLILYTSGTTGVPKGAMLSDAGLLTNLQAIEGYFRINGRIRIARPLYHCAVLVGEFLLALARGVDIVFDNGDFQPLRHRPGLRRVDNHVLYVPVLHACRHAACQLGRDGKRDLCRPDASFLDARHGLCDGVSRFRVLHEGLRGHGVEQSWHSRVHGARRRHTLRRFCLP